MVSGSISSWDAASYLLQLSPIQSVALAQQQEDLDETQQEEDRVVRLFEVDVEGIEVKPVDIGSARKLKVGQSCYAIGNPYGYENTLTTGVVSGLGREIPSPNMGAIRGAIQTDAAINSGNSGGPLLDSHGNVIGVNTATFTRKGSGMSSGVNFAIPIDTVLQTVPFLIVYGTAYRDRF
ncbi:peptidase S1C, Peptidase S1, PA clan [Artemisia annua]|uniref:Peptidase S1C, Peptidase S1, PA clan n=1 Tax=Artemisia annua TaxID=35608 RepID=A0A2U1Q159_ARTAN|nr:peptidase S1C, Peptidase S1, PA clan [Artemisia annua]